MGNTQDNNKENQYDFLERIIYIQSRDSSNSNNNLGRIEVYRFKQPPYQYIVKYQRTFMLQDPNCIQYLSMIQSFKNKVNHRNLAKIHQLTVKQQIHMCIRNITLTTYVNYYTFTLQQVLAQRRLHDTRFTVGQLWYILYSFVDLATYLQEVGVAYGSYDLNSINLSPQGYIKMYAHHITAHNRHTPYYSVLSDASNIIKHFPLPPQYLKLLQNNYDYTNKPDIYLADCFSVGMSLLQLMQDQPGNKYYCFIGNDIVFDKRSLKDDLDNLRHVYPASMLYLVERLLEQEPSNRWKFSQALTYMEEIRNDISISGCIKMFHDEDNPIYPKVSFKTNEDRNLSEIVLSQLENHLTVIPIKTISKEPKNNKSQNYQKHGVSLICRAQINLKTPTPKLTKFSRLSSLESRTNSKDVKKIKIMFPR